MFDYLIEKNRKGQFFGFYVRYETLADGTGLSSRMAALYKVTDEWFLQLSRKYEVERMELKEKIADRILERSKHIRQLLNQERQLESNELTKERKFER